MEYEGNNVEEEFGLTFQVSYKDVFGDLQACNLKKDGDSIPVTKENLQVSVPTRCIRSIIYWLFVLCCLYQP